MKAFIILLLFSTFSFGCTKKESPVKYFTGKVVRFSCRPIVQVEGLDIGENWQGYKNVVLVDNLGYYFYTPNFPADSVFYFKGYEYVGFEHSNCSPLLLGISINITDFSPTRPQ